jgi:hypothetical protein
MSNVLTQTTLSAAISSMQTVFNVASASNLSAPVNNFFQKIYVLDPGSMRGELMVVTGLSGTTVTVSRLDQFKSGHVNGAVVLINPIDPSQETWFVEKDPSPVPATTPVATQLVNVVTGAQWLYSTVTASWVPGWNNPTAPPSPTAAVASAAAEITPSGPLFHITGTSAITGFVQPTGFTSGSITVIPDGTFTWTTANNIALAGTAVVDKIIIFTYDWNSAAWYPSVVA